jgi:hypothetical protein
MHFLDKAHEHNRKNRVRLFHSHDKRFLRVQISTLKFFTKSNAYAHRSNVTAMNRKYLTTTCWFPENQLVEQKLAEDVIKEGTNTQIF